MLPRAAALGALAFRRATALAPARHSELQRRAAEMPHPLGPPMAPGGKNRPGWHGSEGS
jgi:hypothetical protein